MTKNVSQARSHNYLRQVKGSVLFKGLAVACSFLSIPLMIHYLGQAQYGVWSTLLSVMTWITFFDLGLGNGLRNKLAESLAKEQADEARNFVSSAYSLIGLISLTLFVILAIAAFTVPWQKVFNTQLLSAEKLSYAVMITGFFIALNFWVSLINSVLNAVQKTSVVVLGQFLFNALSLLLVYILTKTTEASLLYLATAYGVSMVGANVLLSGWFYKGNLSLIPRISLDFSHVRPLLGLGVQFFVIQIAVLVIFTTDKILITQLFGPEFVTPYDVVFKLFSVITLACGLIMAPLWSSYTDAYHRNDIAWIKHMLHKQIIIFGGIAMVVVVMGTVAKPVIALWIGGELVVPLSLVIAIGLFVLVSAWVNIFAFFLNGVQKIQASLVISIVAMLLNIPVSIFLAKHTSLGVSSVMFGTVCALVPGVFLGPYQTIKIITKQDTGIWCR